MMSLTTKQKKVLASIKELERTNNKIPTLEEIRSYLSYGSISAVQIHLDALEDKGYIIRNKYAKRGIEVLNKDKLQIPLVGNVSCGRPIFAEENIEAYILISPEVIKGNYKDYFILRAQGDSMDKAGINDGDLVLIKRQETAEDGDKVVTLIGDEATIKAFYKKKDHYELLPVSSNPKNKKIILFEDFRVQGIVKGVIGNI